MNTTRRSVITGLATTAVAVPPAFAQNPVDARGFGLHPDPGADQTASFASACLAAAEAGLPLFLPAGVYVVGTVDLPSGLLLQGVPGATVLRFGAAGGGLRARGCSAVTLDGLVLDGASMTAAGADGLVQFDDSDGVTVLRCAVRGSRGNGIGLARSAARIEDCDITGCDEAAVFSLDGRGVAVTGCRISDCGNGGVLIWRSASGRDGSLVSGNSITAIASRSGGNGQNGNGINVFRAGAVTVAGNTVTGAQFSAIRLNATDDCQVVGNTCLDCQEVAIFSEFGFSGSVVANNIVDGAAQGISITNFNEGGRLATCTGNIVRNIFPRSAVNPDTVPVGIAAEADTVISGNVVEAVPGLGIGAGWGPYLRDVAVSGNVVRDSEIGIGVSVAPGAGKAVVASNLVSGARRAGIAGMAWSEMVSDDLVREAARFPALTLSGNAVG